MTETREQMEARHAAELAALEAREREPDWDAAVLAFCDAYDRDCYGSHENSVRLGLIAALPLAPLQVMGEAEIEALADKIYEEWLADESVAGVRQAIPYTIRKTLARQPIAADLVGEWPGEATLSVWAADIANDMVGFVCPARKNAALHMANRLRAYLTQAARPAGDAS